MRKKNYWNPTIILEDEKHKPKIKEVCKKNNISLARWLGRVIDEAIDEDDDLSDLYLFNDDTEELFI
jgi:hypothetical protein